MLILPERGFRPHAGSCGRAVGRRRQKEAASRRWPGTATRPGWQGPRQCTWRAEQGVGWRSVQMCITEMRVPCMTAKQGLDVLFCTPNRTNSFPLVSVMAGPSRAWTAGDASGSLPAACAFGEPAAFAGNETPPEAEAPAWRAAQAAGLRGVDEQRPSVMRVGPAAAPGSQAPGLERLAPAGGAVPRRDLPSFQGVVGAGCLCALYRVCGMYPTKRGS
jgi:hypothetical protein